jgi:hypothetical protein
LAAVPVLVPPALGAQRRCQPANNRGCAHRPASTRLSGSPSSSPIPGSSARRAPKGSRGNRNCEVSFGSGQSSRTFPSVIWGTQHPTVPIAEQLRRRLLASAIESPR